jgi:hypothetical protein
LTQLARISAIIVTAPKTVVDAESNLQATKARLFPSNPIPKPTLKIGLPPHVLPFSGV